MTTNKQNTVRVKKSMLYWYPLPYLSSKCPHCSPIPSTWRVSHGSPPTYSFIRTQLHKSRFHLLNSSAYAREEYLQTSAPSSSGYFRNKNNCREAPHHLHFPYCFLRTAVCCFTQIRLALRNLKKQAICWTCHSLVPTKCTLGVGTGGCRWQWEEVHIIHTAHKPLLIHPCGL